jgi:hypothetical protein
MNAILRALSDDEPGTAAMNTKTQEIDISNSSELLELVEEVRQSGDVRLLKRGEQALAMLIPLSMPRKTPPDQQSTEKQRDTILNIIGIGASATPTDIAQHEQEYLGEAYTPTRR